MTSSRRSFLALSLAAAAALPSWAQQAAGRFDRRDLFASRRAGKKTLVAWDSSDRAPLEPPPAGAFDIVAYPSAVGPLKAYLTPDPKDGKKHPAIIWLTGGETNTIGDVWSPRDRDDDQSASAYRKAGIVTMFPSLRGGNENPGRIEGCYGEIDDVIAARDWLAQQPWVDPARIYLGGHSTGGTLAMLVAEATDRFRATFAFGPVSSFTRYYGDDIFPFDLGTIDVNKAVDEALYRAPGYWLPSVKARLFVIEGTVDGNVDLLREMKEMDKKDGRNANIEFIEVSGLDHFSILAPANEAIARRITSDTGAATNIRLTSSELKKGR